MAVRAKFKVQMISRTENWDKSKGEIHTVTLQPVTAGNAENDAFFAATPSGKIELGMVNGKVGEQFVLGKSYYVDFTEAE